MRSIAIDGPAGAGKSTLAKQVAKSLGYIYVDTGAIYRTVGLAAHRNHIDPKDVAAIESLLPSIQISMGYDADGTQSMFLNGENVSMDIRQHEMSKMASVVSAIPAVRAFLLDFQRQQAQEHNVIMDGRDIGTVVLPDASVKIYLTADAEYRAKRRLLELQERGQQAEFETVLRDIIDRDYQDMNRPIAPLCQAEDAILLDTTHLNKEESFNALLALCVGEGDK